MGDVILTENIIMHSVIFFILKSEYLITELRAVRGSFQLNPNKPEPLETIVTTNLNVELKLSCQILDTKSIHYKIRMKRE